MMKFYRKVGQTVIKKKIYTSMSRSLGIHRSMNYCKLPYKIWSRRPIHSDQMNKKLSTVKEPVDHIWYQSGHVKVWKRRVYKTRDIVMQLRIFYSCWDSLLFFIYSPASYVNNLWLSIRVWSDLQILTAT